MHRKETERARAETSRELGSCSLASREEIAAKGYTRILLYFDRRMEGSVEKIMAERI